MSSASSCRFCRALVILVLLVGAIVFVGWYKLFREVRQSFDSAEAYFKYGSIGAEKKEGLPYWIWLALPQLFPEYLPGPGGYTALGFAWEEGQETPVGFSKKIIGFPRIGINCAVCHTATYRTKPEEMPRVVPTGPSQRLDSLGYVRFLSACAADPRFNPDILLPAIAYHVELSWLEKLLYRYVIIPQARKGILEQQERYAWTASRPLWGPGRIDPFNPVKFNPDILDLDPAHDTTIGNSDMQPLWNMEQRQGHALHWDGLNRSLTEVVLTGAIGDGATLKSLPLEEMAELESYIKRKQPPPYPFPEALDPKQVAQGKKIYQAHCAVCHAPEGEKTGEITPLAEIATDRHRLDMWTEESARRYNAYADGSKLDFHGFVKTDGYVNVPLDGLWLRAPYLHNGSVPTLEALLEPASQRPQVFYRGYDVYEYGGTGFIHQGSEAEQHGFKYDTREKGNSNAGHEGPDYGTDLSPADKRALIEYLKTL